MLESAGQTNDIAIWTHSARQEVLDSAKVAAVVVDTAEAVTEDKDRFEEDMVDTVVKGRAREAVSGEVEEGIEDEAALLRPTNGCISGKSTLAWV